ncbi:hypothetical protein N0V83_008979 [Neocucurbitaria cava]|uniref:C2H2-type domain-containing protein n=1 Tax=Neocucurbitaria cava TaxID=798079 RepID=A0A9W8Y1V3_9PLEO|nr:hypothetical protein N0V83_008979 [Neocucurbitaria cava]
MNFYASHPRHLHHVVTVLISAPLSHPSTDQWSSALPWNGISGYDLVGDPVSALDHLYANTWSNSLSSVHHQYGTTSFDAGLQRTSPSNTGAGLHGFQQLAAGIDQSTAQGMVVDLAQYGATPMVPLNDNSGFNDYAGSATAMTPDIAQAILSYPSGYGAELSTSPNNHFRFNNFLNYATGAVQNMAQDMTPYPSQYQAIMPATNHFQPNHAIPPVVTQAAINAQTRAGDALHCPEGCPATFARPADYRRHMKKHKPHAFPCLKIDCGKTFSRKDKLRDHMRQGHKFTM